MRCNTMGGFLPGRMPDAGWQLFTLVAVVAVGLNAGSALAADVPVQQDASGTLQVYGSLTESTCQVEMESLRQTIALGNTDRARLMRPGDRGTPVNFQIRLTGCTGGRSAARDPRTGTLTWSSDQPAVSVLFFGNSDPDAPDYLQVEGAGGVALQLSDPHGRLLPVSQRAVPLLLSPGQNQLNWTVTPVRTAAPFRAGAYRASVNFRMIYD